MTAIITIREAARVLAKLLPAALVAMIAAIMLNDSNH